MGTAPTRCDYMHRTSEWPYARRCWEMNANYFLPLDMNLCPSHEEAALKQRDADKARHPSNQKEQ